MKWRCIVLRFLEQAGNTSILNEGQKKKVFFAKKIWKYVQENIQLQFKTAVTYFALSVS